MSDFAFAPKDITVKPGESTFYLVNEGKVSHDMTVLDPAGNRIAQSGLVQPGNTDTLKVKLDAGSYRVICSQPGHADSGMVATLRVSG